MTGENAQVFAGEKVSALITREDGTKILIKDKQPKRRFLKWRV